MTTTPGKQKCLHAFYAHNISALDGASELPDLLAVASKLRPGSAAVAVFFVSSLNDAGTPSAKGITTMIGGVNGANATALGGIALAVDAGDFDKFMQLDPTGQAAAKEYGRVLAHEVGHFLGLWHTTEVDGFLQDLVHDTPKCKLPKGHQVITSEDCPLAATNLMFPGDAGNVVSSGQAAVVSRHPAPR